MGSKVTKVQRIKQNKLPRLGKELKEETVEKSTPNDLNQSTMTSNLNLKSRPEACFQAEVEDSATLPGMVEEMRNSSISCDELKAGKMNLKPLPHSNNNSNSHFIDCGKLILIMIYIA